MGAEIGPGRRRRHACARRFCKRRKKDKAGQDVKMSSTAGAPAPKPSPVAAPASAAPKSAPNASAAAQASAALAGAGQKDQEATNKS